MKNNLPAIVIGAGGHARVVADTLLASGHKVLGFTDADTALHGKMLLGCPVLGDDGVLQQYSPEKIRLANGIGITNHQVQSLRQRLQQSLQTQGWYFIGVKHPSAVVSTYTEINSNVQIMAGSIIQCGAFIGEGSIINTGAIIEHDVHIGDWTHIAPAAVLCGEVSIGNFCHIGAGATVRQQIILGENCLVGAGAVVTKSANGSIVLTGIPAREYRKS